MQSPGPRKTPTPYLQSLGSKSKKKQFHAHRGATGVGKETGPSSAAKRQNEPMSPSQLEQALTEIIGEEGLRRSQDESGPKLEFGQGMQADLRFDRFRGSWKSAVAHDCRNAVVKILNEMVQFDWEQPYKRADEGQAIGSGFFISKDGLIVTNAHVVEGAYKIWITVPSEGEERYEASVLGICFDVDLALLKCADAPVRKFLELGDSNTVQYGQEVLTLGYPLGMESLKLTEGIISGRQDEFFQTDAPLNPGNSGGPMLSSDAKVIGINVAIAERSQNVGFSIPVYQLQMILENLKTRPPGKLVLHKPILGAEFNNCSDAMLAFMGLPKEKKGLYVAKVFEGFPLYNAGVREGDILHKFNKFTLDNFGQAEVPWSPYARASLESLMNLMVNDSKPEIEYSTNGAIKTSTVIFEDPKNKGCPILPAIREYQPPFERIDYEVICGAVFMDLTLNHIQMFHEELPSEQVLRSLTPVAASFTERMKGAVVITNIFMGSTLSKIDVFSPGTLIQKVNNIPVSNLAELREAMKKPVQKKDELFITITSHENDLAVFSLRDTFREELELSQAFFYQLSPIVLNSLATGSDELVNYVTKNNKAMKKRLKAMIAQLQKEEEEEEED